MEKEKMRIFLREKDNSAFQPYLDVFLCDGAVSPLSAVLILPGGGYDHRAYHEGDPIARKFNALGFHAFVLQYRVLPDPFPCAQLDVLRAIKIIRSRAKEFRLNPEQIAVMGFSAGGHLATCASFMHDQFDEKCGDEADNFSSKVNALVLCYPVTSVTETYIELNRPLAKNTPYCFADGTPIDPYKMVNSNTPPTFIWHTATDDVVLVNSTMEYAKAMWKCNNTCDLHVFPFGPHGQGLCLGYPDASMWPEQAAVFLQKRIGFTAAFNN
jgi:acetyl esterase/lipase